VTVNRGNGLCQGVEAVPLHFEIMDEGIGIAESVRERLFQNFTQADSSITRRFGGTGLGLAICKQVVEHLGGEIGVSSRPGVGSTFWFNIPLERSAASIIDREAIANQFQHLHALVVDHLDINVEIMRRQLEAFEIFVTTETDAFRAMADLEQAWHRGQPYDVVFLDQMTQDNLGEALHERMRSYFSLADTKLIIVSATRRASISRNSTLKLEAVLGKPVRVQELHDTLTNACRPPAVMPSNDTLEPSPPNLDILKSGLRVLLAEDNIINQQYAVAILHKAGHHVTVAENGREAVDAIRSANYDLVLMDIQMPELDGVEATRLIRALPPPKSGLPIIALTAHAMRGLVEEFLGAGMNDYVSKPFQPALLLEKLGRFGAPVQEVAPEGVDQSQSDLPVLDFEKLVLLEALLPAEEFNNFISLYLNSVENHICEMQANSESGNFAGVASQAHMLMGSTGNLGAVQTCAMARVVERTCATREKEKLEPLLKQLRQSITESSNAVRAWLYSRDDKIAQASGC
jgi:CheY-like chemotaxis protein